MKIILKILGVLILVVILLILGGIGYLKYLDYSDGTFDEDLRREFRSEKIYLNHKFTIVFEDPPMSFGSGHKVLILTDSSTGKKIDEVYFGEHPLTIKDISSNRIDLNIPKSGYTQSWCSNADKIDKYKINCVFY